MPKKKKGSATVDTGIERFSIAGLEFPVAPAALRFYAVDYLRAAVASNHKATAWEPATSELACHALELCLKAFLSLEGHTLEGLSSSKFGHNLVALLGHAFAMGLRSLAKLSEKEREEIIKAAIYYDGRAFAYPAMVEAAKAYPHQPDVDILIAVATRLVEVLREPCAAA